jgi:uncharacterized protein YbaR (Trm112 family)
MVGCGQRGEGLMRAYGEIWASLDRDAGKSRRDGHIRHHIHPDVSNLELYLAASVPDRRRSLWVRIDREHAEGAAKLPKWNGLDISVVLGKERPKPKTYLLIMQGENGPSDMFEAIIEDICQSLLANRRKPPFATISNRLEAWKHFFEERGGEFLSRQEQLGLFGELWFLRAHLIPSLGAEKAIQAWTGPSGQNHDFKVGRIAFEVKSTAVKQHHKFCISNERQLDTTGFSDLRLVSLSFETVGGGESLPSIVVQISDLLGDQQKVSDQFHAKMLQAGYTRFHDQHYQQCYAHRQTRVFDVREGFPRLLERDLPNGVGDITYTIMLSACKEYEIGLGGLLLPNKGVVRHET